jgi:hypothetical protein
MGSDSHRQHKVITVGSQRVTAKVSKGFNMPRKLGYALKHFEEIDVWQYKCIYCPKTFKMLQASRAAEHLALYCQNVPDDIKRCVFFHHNTKAMQSYRFQEHFQAQAEKNSAGSERSSAGASSFSQSGRSSLGASSSVMSPPPCKRFKTSKSILDYVHHCSPAEAQAINEALVNILAVCAVPFNIVTMAAFVDMLRALNSSFMLRPSSGRLRHQKRFFGDSQGWE